MLAIRSKDVWAGLSLLVFAGLYYLGAGGLATGSATDMGPGYFPKLLAGLLGVIGLAILLRGVLRDGEAIDGWSKRPLLLIIGALVAFAFSIERLGLVISSALLLAIGSSATPAWRLTETVVLTVVLIAGAWAIFVLAIGLPIRVWPTL